VLGGAEDHRQGDHLGPFVGCAGCFGQQQVPVAAPLPVRPSSSQAVWWPNEDACGCVSPRAMASTISFSAPAGGALRPSTAGPAASGWDEDQCWTLARVTEVIRSRFKADYTLAGADLLLHRIGWSVQVPARQAAERDEARIGAWREEVWPVVKGPRRTWVPG
jgi:Winged helix-turn helix